MWCPGFNGRKRSELVGKGITPIDFGPLFPKCEWIDPDLRHKNALEWFALNLMYGAPPNPMRWPEPSEKTYWKASNQLIPDIPLGPHDYQNWDLFHLYYSLMIDRC